MTEEHHFAAQPPMISTSQSTKNLQLLIDRIVDYGIFLLDPHGFVVTWNTGARKIKGYEAEEIIGQHFSRFYPQEDIDNNKPSYELAAASSDGRFEDEGWRVRKDGTRFWANVIITALRDQNGVLQGFGKVTRDLTERRVMEVALNDSRKETEEALRHMEWYNKQIMILSTLSGMLQSCLTLDEAYEPISKFIHRLFPNVSGALYLLHPSRTFLEMVSHWGEVNFEEIFAPEACWGLRRGRPHMMADEHAVLCPHVLREHSAGARLCIPMMAQGEALGLLYLADTTRVPSTESVLSTIGDQFTVMVAEQLALGIGNLKLREILRNQSIRDPLTQLYNRRFLDESMVREIARAGRSSKPLSVLILDIDHFKQYNDTYGHDAGDVVLKHLANLMLTQFRKSDVVCRYGGEEFVVLLPECDLQQAWSKAQQLIVAVSSMRLSMRNINLQEVTISVGVSSLTAHNSTGDGLLFAADQALLRAKNAGRNRAVMADSPLTEISTN